MSTSLDSRSAKRETSGRHRGRAQNLNAQQKYRDKKKAIFHIVSDLHTVVSRRGFYSMSTSRCKLINIQAKVNGCGFSKTQPCDSRERDQRSPSLGGRREESPADPAKRRSSRCSHSEISLFRCEQRGSPGICGIAGHKQNRVVEGQVVMVWHMFRQNHIKTCRIILVDM